MPRARQESDPIEQERLNLIREKQIELGKRLTRPTPRKRNAEMPGEIYFKKRLAIVRKISEPGISYEQIADELGEARTAVKNWFAEAEVQEEYQFILENLSSAALKSLQTYALEAVHALVTIIRFGSEKYMHDAAIAILDRAGVPKISRIEQTKEETTNHNWSSEEMVETLRTLSEEDKEIAAQGIEMLNDLLEKAANG